MEDREKIIKGLEHIQGLTSLQCLNFPSERMEFHNLIADVLALLKKQDMKTGKWTEKTDYMGDTYYDCSVCNESWMTIDGTPWVNGMNYCPHCGAKMKT